MEELKYHKMVGNQCEPEEVEKQHRARINNNARYMRAQDQVFTNLNSEDRMIAYSLNMNCQSLASVRYSQIESLLSTFKAQDVHDNTSGQQTFKNIIKNRFQQSEVADPQNEGSEVESNDQDEQDYDDEGDSFENEAGVN